MKKRKYTLGKRALQQDETRQRIVDATVALHEELGPRHTTISAIAERAGVQRLTVYRHFADEQSLFEACTSSWLERHPAPAPPAFEAARVKPETFTARALQALYAYYRSTGRMLEVSYRDLELVPAMQAPMQRMLDHVDAYRDALLAAWTVPVGRRSALRATLAIAVQFRSWQALDRLGLSDAAMADLALRWVAAAARA